MLQRNVKTLPHFRQRGNTVWFIFSEDRTDYEGRKDYRRPYRRLWVGPRQDVLKPRTRGVAVKMDRTAARTGSRISRTYRAPDVQDKGRQGFHSDSKPSSTVTEIKHQTKTQVKKVKWSFPDETDYKWVTTICGPRSLSLARYNREELLFLTGHGHEGTAMPGKRTSWQFAHSKTPQLRWESRVQYCSGFLRCQHVSVTMKQLSFYDIFIKTSQGAKTPQWRLQGFLARPWEITQYLHGPVTWREAEPHDTARALLAFLLETIFSALTIWQIWTASGWSLATELLDQMALIYLFYKGKRGGKKAWCKLESPFLVIEQKNKREKKLILSSSRCYMLFYFQSYI